MPLTTDNVQSILETAITQANLAPTEEVIRGIATTLAQAITPSLNDLLGTQTGLISTVKVTAPVMSVSEALVVRDAVSSVITETEVVPAFAGGNLIAEALLIVGYVDVPAILASVRKEDAKPTLSTGSRAAVSAGTGSIPAS